MIIFGNGEDCKTYFCFVFGFERERGGVGSKEFNLAYVKVETLHTAKCNCQVGNLIYESGVQERNPG